MAIGRIQTTPTMPPSVPVAPPLADGRFDRLMAQIRRTPVAPAEPAGDPRIPPKPDAIIGASNSLRESPTSRIDPERIAAAVMNYESPSRPGLLRPDETGRAYTKNPLKRLDVLTEFRITNNNGREELNVLLNANTRSPMPVSAAEFFGAMWMHSGLLDKEAVVIVQQARKMDEVPPALEKEMKSTALLTGVNIGVELKDGRIFVAWANEQKAGADLSRPTPPVSRPGGEAAARPPVGRVAPADDGKPLPKLDLPRFANAGVDLDALRSGVTQPFEPRRLRVAVENSVSQPRMGVPPSFAGVGFDPARAKPYQGEPLSRIDVLAGVKVSNGELMVSARPGTRSERFTSVDVPAAVFKEANVLKPNGFLVFTPRPDKLPEVNPALEKAVGEAAQRNGVNIAVDLGAQGVLIGRTDGSFEWNKESVGKRDPRFD